MTDVRERMNPMMPCRKEEIVLYQRKSDSDGCVDMEKKRRNIYRKAHRAYLRSKECPAISTWKKTNVLTKQMNLQIRKEKHYAKENGCD